VHADDNFFLLGGNSLSATRAVSRLAARCGIDLPLSSIFLHPTVAEMAAEISQVSGADPQAAGSGAAAAAAGGPLPLTPGQQRLWFLDQLQPGHPAYNVAFGLRLRGRLDRDALRSAMAAAVARHRALRSCFRLGDDRQPVQIANSPDVFALIEEDIPGGDHAAALRRSERDAGQPFDLATGPLIRARLSRLGPEDHILSLTVHHAAIDGWSIEVLLSDVSKLYTGYRAGQSPALPSLEAAYRHQVTRLHTRPDDPGQAEHLAYWRQHLAGLPKLELPADRPRPRRTTGQGAQHRFTLLPETQARLLRGVCEANRVTAFTVLLSAFQLTLARVTGQEDIVVGTPVSGREQAGSEGLVGFFANTLVLRTDLSGAAAFTDVVARTQATMLGALAHSDVPFGTLVETINPKRKVLASPLVQVMFSVQDERQRAIELPGLAVDVFDIYNGTAKFDLDVTVAQRSDGLLLGVIEYNTDIFSDGTIAELAARYRNTLETCTAHPEQDLDT
jgi:hypothetical protein